MALHSHYHHRSTQHRRAGPAAGATRQGDFLPSLQQCRNGMAWDVQNKMHCANTRAIFINIRWLRLFYGVGINIPMHWLKTLFILQKVSHRPPGPACAQSWTVEPGEDLKAQRPAIHCIAMVSNVAVTPLRPGSAKECNVMQCSTN
jgi:hypothetical protein